MSLADQQGETPRPAGEELFEAVRVEIEEMDMLLEGVSEASVQLRALRQELDTLDRARQLAGNLLDCVSLQLKIETNGNRWMDNGSKVRTTAEDLRTYLERLGRNLSIGVDQVEAEFTQVRDATNRLRLLPAATVFSSLERAVRDAAQSLHKEVMFESFGGANRLDAHVLAALRDALLRSEEHTSELQSHLNLVCRLLLEKKKKELPILLQPSCRASSHTLATEHLSFNSSATSIESPRSNSRVGTTYQKTIARCASCHVT